MDMHDGALGFGRLCFSVLPAFSRVGYDLLAASRDATVPASEIKRVALFVAPGALSGFARYWASSAHEEAPQTVAASDFGATKSTLDVSKCLKHFTLGYGHSVSLPRCFPELATSKSGSAPHVVVIGSAIWPLGRSGGVYAAKAAAVHRT
jgi:hypothetical protein